MVGPRRTFVIVASQYNPVYVQGLVDHAAQELAALSPNSQILLRQVPGAFEIPLIVQEFAGREGITAIIALGVIIEGETQHANLIARTVTDSLMEIALKNRIPVIHEVLLVKDEEQARKRCLEPELNRGLEAARAAVQISQLLAEIKAKA
jgi:6,7-dimethyl-8-ribityllumazine synthase